LGTEAVLFKKSGGASLGLHATMQSKLMLRASPSIAVGEE